MARNFNGTTDYIDTVTGPSIATGAPFSFSCWASLSSGAGTFPIMADDGGSNSIFFGVNLTAFAGFNLFVNGEQSTNNTSVANNTFFQVVGTFDGTSSLIFVNGIQQGGNTGSVTPTGFSKLLLGNGTEGGNSFWKGSLAHFGVWNIALSQADITNLASGAAPILIEPSSLIGYWPLAGTASPEPDLSGSGNNGALFGTTAAADPPGIFTVWGPGVATTLTNGVPARLFTRKNYYELMAEILREGVAEREARKATDAAKAQQERDASIEYERQINERKENKRRADFEREMRGSGRVSAAIAGRAGSDRSSANNLNDRLRHLDIVSGAFRK